MPEQEEQKGKSWKKSPWGHSFLYTLFVFVLFFGGCVAGISYRIRYENGRESITGLPYHHRPQARDRVLILSPHCDDETLGCGGFLYDTVRAGGALRVVFITNGDGFPLAVRRAYPHVRIRPTDYVRFGIRRQHEVCAALAKLGVPERDVTFLGYPDHGVAQLWLEHWGENNAYTSPYTRVATSPYKNSYRPNAPYCGQDVLEDLERIIREFRPTAVYFPHPNDNHPDHWATSCFAQAALERLGMLDRVASYTYLIHQGDWPIPRGLHRERGMAPPAALARLDTRWDSFVLDAAARTAKELALREYRSQMVMMRSFLQSFVRRTELFGIIMPSPSKRIPFRHIQVDGQAGDWQRCTPILLEPVEDTLPVRVDGGADLAAVSACADNSRLYLLLRSRRTLSRRLTYVLHLRTLDGDERALALSIQPGMQPDAPGMQLAAQGQYVEAGIPISRLGGARTIFVGAVARTHRFVIDKTGWRVIQLPPPPAPAQ